MCCWGYVDVELEDPPKKKTPKPKEYVLASSSFNVQPVVSRTLASDVLHRNTFFYPFFIPSPSSSFLHRILRAPLDFKHAQRPISALLTSLPTWLLETTSLTTVVILPGSLRVTAGALGRPGIGNHIRAFGKCRDHRQSLDQTAGINL